MIMDEDSTGSGSHHNTNKHLHNNQVEKSGETECKFD